MHLSKKYSNLRAFMSFITDMRPQFSYTVYHRICVNIFVPHLCMNHTGKEQCATEGTDLKVVSEPLSVSQSW